MSNSKSGFLSQIWRASYLAGGMALAAVCLCGQARSADGIPQQGAALDEITNFKGTLKGFVRGVVNITREDGTEVMVALPNNIANFQFKATAKPPFLQRGMLVRLSGSFGPTGAAVTPIDKVTLFHPVQTNGLPGHAKESFVPGIYPVDRHAKPGQQAAIAKYNVVGNLMGMAGGMMMLQAGKQALRVPLAQNATFEIQYNNLKLAQPGDPVTVAGFYVPPDDTKVKAERITVTTDRVYGEIEEKEPVQRKRRSRRDRTKVEQAEGEAAAEKAEGGEKAEGAAAENGEAAAKQG